MVKINKNMKKAILFYVLMFILIIVMVSEPCVMSLSLFVTSMVALIGLLCTMTKEEIYEVTGAYLFNTLLNTNDFTKE